MRFFLSFNEQDVTYEYTHSAFKLRMMFERCERLLRTDKTQCYNRCSTLVCTPHVYTHAHGRANTNTCIGCVFLLFHLSSVWIYFVVSAMSIYSFVNPLTHTSSQRNTVAHMQPIISSLLGTLSRLFLDRYQTGRRAFNTSPHEWYGVR